MNKRQNLLSIATRLREYRNNPHHINPMSEAFHKLIEQAACELAMVAHHDKRQPAFGDAIGPWHRWFAWFPVRTYDNRFVWLKTVWRRGVQKHDYLTRGGSDFWFQYCIEEPS